MADFYNILGVSKNASEDEIKKAYRKAAVKWHPDRWSGKSESEQKHAEEMFKQVAEANEVLSDPDKRARYDRFGDDWDKMSNNGNFEDIDLSDIFARMHGFNPFGGFSSSRQNRGSERGQSIRARINVSIEDIFNGDTRELEVNIKKRCSSCEGTGGDKETCPYCNGTGQHVKTQTFGNQHIQTVTMCEHCNGTGELVKHKCSKCNGTGFVNSKKNIKINIKPGIQNGEELVYSGMGYESKDKHGINGDLIVQCIYNIDSSKYIIQGNDVYEKISIPYYDCILGCTQEVKLPNGKTKTINIPPHSKDGQFVTLYNESFNNGNYIFVISCYMPTTIGIKERSLLEDIRKEHNK